MKKKTIWIGLLAIILIIQLIPSGKPEVERNNPDDLLQNNPVPEKVGKLLRAACYDCHSNESNYPWYAYVAPVSFLVYYDIRHGRDELNFSDWNTLGKIEQAKLLDEIGEAVEEEEMPLPIYPPLHPEARLSDADRQLITDWADSFAESLFE
ncbi:MAG: heme-binding domain-containing protein [Bacteroidales bacterium]|nr:heme-binding domain-containing protein [Bacteroidales bacterium]MCF6341495.1 heme-binding domain-containing protein [Bacteroidales bacterium]